MSENPNAFPACNEANVNGTMGMTLRDWFAGQVLARAYADGGRYRTEGWQQVAEHSYAMADAMLAERERGK